MTESMVDRMAEAMFDSDTLPDTTRKWSEQPQFMREAYVRHALAGILAIKDAGVLLVPVTTSPTAPPVRAADLRVGQVYRMKRGGVRRIDRIERNNLYWTRVDEGRNCGRTGVMWGPGFAKDAVELVELGAALSGGSSKEG